MCHVDQPPNVWILKRQPHEESRVSSEQTHLCHVRPLVRVGVLSVVLILRKHEVALDSRGLASGGVLGRDQASRPSRGSGSAKPGRMPSTPGMKSPSRACRRWT